MHVRATLIMLVISWLPFVFERWSLKVFETNCKFVSKNLFLGTKIFVSTVMNFRLKNNILDENLVICRFDKTKVSWFRDKQFCL